MLAVARALMLRPRLLLLDEPSLGLAPLVVREIFRILRTVNQAGVSILLVEQNAALALDLADHVFLLETGRVVMDGRPTCCDGTTPSAARTWVLSWISSSSRSCRASPPAAFTPAWRSPWS